MKIVLASALYPPDIAEPAPYVKELARRLSGEDQVTVVTYGHLPEQVPGVSIVAVSKRRALPVRLVLYLIALLRALRGADVLYIQNGPSVELPAAAATLALRTPLVMRVGDSAAHRYAQHHPLRRAIERLVAQRAQSAVSDSPAPRPEILPFATRPDASLAAWEQSWQEHIKVLRRLFTHAKN